MRVRVGRVGFGTGCALPLLSRVARDAATSLGGVCRLLRKGALTLLLCRLSYATAVAPAGAKRVTSFTGQWKVGAKPPNSGSFYSPWIGMDTTNNLNLIQPVGPWGVSGSNWVGYTEWFQWKPEKNTNSRQFNVQPGETLFGSMVYIPAIDSYNLTQRSSSGGYSAQIVPVIAGQDYTVRFTGSLVRIDGAEEWSPSPSPKRPLPAHHNPRVSPPTAQPDNRRARHPRAPSNLPVFGGPSACGWEDDAPWSARNEVHA